MNKVKKASSIAIALPVLLLFAACQKDVGVSNTDGTTKYSVYITDGPTDYQQVLIDIQKVEIKLDTCKRNSDPDHDRPGCDDDHDRMDTSCNVWQTLNINAGVYDLLQFRNGLDTLLASGDAPAGKIERIKVTLGSSNSVVVDGSSYPLNLINNQNFVFLNIHREHLDSAAANHLELHLDFDLLHSIRYFNGQYWLKPVLKPFGEHSSGEIKGRVMPANSFGMIMAYNGTDTAYARPGEEGKFKIRGLQDGTYNVSIDGINNYQDSTITGINVQRRREVDLGVITLHQ